jgi:DNA-binding beta-propeller fold protein YncE
VVYATSIYDNTVRMFDADTHAAMGTIAVGRGPMALAVDGSRLYVANQWAQDDGDAYVSVIDTTSHTVTGSLGVSTKAEGPDPNNYPTTGFPQGIAVMNGRLYVTFPTNAQPDLIPVDVGTWQEHTMIPAGSGPWHLAGVGSELVVPNEGGIGDPTDDAILEIDPASGKVLAKHATPGFIGEAASAGGKGWVARAMPGETTGLVMVVDPATHALRSVTVGQGPEAVTTDGTNVYVACRQAQRIDVIDPATETVVDTIDLKATVPPIPDPRGLTVTPSGAIYVRTVDGNVRPLPKTSLYVVTR